MADSKISALTALATTPASGDLLVLVDISDTTMAASGTNKKITFANLTGTFLLTSGATTGATSQAQTFTNGIVGPTWKPASDSTTAIRVQDAAGSSSALTIDTSNLYVGVNTTPTAPFHVNRAWGTLPAGTTVTTQFSTSGNGDSGGTSGLRMLAFSNTSAGANNISEMTAITGDVFVGGTAGAVTTAQVASVSVRLTNAATATTVYGFRSWASLTSSGSITGNLYHFQARAPSLTSSGTIATSTGLLIELQKQTGVTTGRGVWSTGATDINAFAGLTAFGSTTTPTALVHIAASTTARASACVVAGTAPTTPVVGDIWNDGALTFYNADSTTNAVVNHLRLRRNSTGTAAAGFGLGIIAELESTTTDAQSAGRLTWAWETATHASRAAVGKLTAYYTSTEREIITFLADSAAGKVGINNTSPSYALDGLAPGGGAANIFRFGQTGVSNGFTVTSDGATLTYAMLTGNLGLGTTSPQAILHAHDGSGGFLFVNRTGVSSTLVTVIPDGTGDVTERLHMFGWVSNSAGGFVSQVNEVYLDVSSSTTKTDGSNTLTIAVTAAGAFTLQTTLGTATWKVLLWVFWR